MKAILETWRPVVGYEGVYEVSDSGCVRSLNYNHTTQKREMTGYAQANRYRFVTLTRGATQKQCLVHRLVWEAFNGPIPDGMQVDHIDGNKRNNALRNLRVVTPKQNTNNPATRVRMLEAIQRRTNSDEWRQKNRESVQRRQRNTEWLKKVRCGVRRARAKAVLQIDKCSGKVVRRWECAADAWRELGIGYRNISDCCRGGRKTAGGFRWEFAE